MGETMDRFARRVFAFAGIYGLIVLVPQLFAESRVSHDYPPAITHPEYFYGFLGVAIAWNLCFLVIARDPVRFRAAMIPAMVEKLAFGVPSLVLYSQHRLSLVTTCFATFDLVLLTLFILAYRRTPLNG
jgi:hypothetical protein